jgi:hypothetical protein
MSHCFNSASSSTDLDVVYGKFRGEREDEPYGQGSGERAVTVRVSGSLYLPLLSSLSSLFVRAFLLSPRSWRRN